MTVSRATLFDFSDPSATATFAAIDDRVMGGVSLSGLEQRDDRAVFRGTLSTDRGGGFASVRSGPAAHDLSAQTGLVLRVRGDGRTYQLRLRMDDALDGVSYVAAFPTTAGAWTQIELPFERFTPTLRGRVPRDAPDLDPTRIRTLGLMVADGQVGEFELELAWIGAF